MAEVIGGTFNRGKYQEVIVLLAVVRGFGNPEERLRGLGTSSAGQDRIIGERQTAAEFEKAGVPRRGGREQVPDRLRLAGAAHQVRGQKLGGVSPVQTLGPHHG